MKFGFFEIVFNLFLGMGGYLLVVCKVNCGFVELLIVIGEVYVVEWYEDCGLIDEMFDVGDVYFVMCIFIDVMKFKLNGICVMLCVCECVF